MDIKPPFGALNRSNSLGDVEGTTFSLYESKNVSELEMGVVAGEVFALCQKSTTYLALVGPMGAGKTTFTRSACHSIDSRAEVCSPTYSMENCYVLERDGQTTFVRHWDLFRGIDSEEQQLLEEPQGKGGIDQHFSREIIIVEWPEKLVNPEEIFDIIIVFNCDVTHVASQRTLHIWTRT